MFVIEIIIISQQITEYRFEALLEISDKWNTKSSVIRQSGESQNGCLKKTKDVRVRVRG